MSKEIRALKDIFVTNNKEFIALEDGDGMSYGRYVSIEERGNSKRLRKLLASEARWLGIALLKAAEDLDFENKWCTERYFAWHHWSKEDLETVGRHKMARCQCCKN